MYQDQENWLNRMYRFFSVVVKLKKTLWPKRNKLNKTINDQKVCNSKNKIRQITNAHRLEKYSKTSLLLYYFYFHFVSDSDELCFYLLCLYFLVNGFFAFCGNIRINFSFHSSIIFLIVAVAHQLLLRSLQFNFMVWQTMLTMVESRFVGNSIEIDTTTFLAFYSCLLFISCNFFLLLLLPV